METSDGSKVKHRTRTLVTRTQPTELRSATGERIRPRTKNVNYHVFNSEKLPLATFPDDDTEQAVSNLLSSQDAESGANANGFDASLVKTESDFEHARKKDNSLPPGRHIIEEGKVVKIIKGGIVVKNNRRRIKQEPAEEESGIQEAEVHIKEEVVDPSPLHELAELSMQHAQNMFRCEMCSAVFSDRAQLLVHVPVHI